MCPTAQSTAGMGKRSVCFLLSERFAELACSWKKMQVEVNALGKRGLPERGEQKGSVQLTKQENVNFSQEERGKATVL